MLVLGAVIDPNKQTLDTCPSDIPVTNVPRIDLLKTSLGYTCYKRPSDRPVKNVPRIDLLQMSLG